MNPALMSRIGPELRAALARRQQGGMGGGNTMPAQQQVMAPNPLGGPMGASQTPLATSPQAMPVGSIQQSSGLSGQNSLQQALVSAGGQSQPAQGTTGSGASGGSSKSDPNTVLMKALLQRLVADI